MKQKPSEAAGSFDLGALIGQRKAFGTIAGRCSAAEAATIRRIREQRLYRSTELPWGEFCKVHLGMCRTQADRLIRVLEEFGPDFFEVAQLTRIPPEAYRAIAPAVKDGHVHWNGEAIALLPENAARVAAAVTALRETAKPAALEPPAPPPSSHHDAIEALTAQSNAVVAGWNKLVEQRTAFAPQDRQTLRNRIAHTRQELARLEGRVWPQPSRVLR